MQIGWRWTDHGPCLALALAGSIGLRIGWGYDADLPLRLWPAAHLGRTPAGRSDLCGAWMGLYIGVTWGVGR